VLAASIVSNVLSCFALTASGLHHALSLPNPQRPRGSDFRLQLLDRVCRRRLATAGNTLKAAAVFSLRLACSL